MDKRVGWEIIVGRNNIAPNVINRRSRRNTLRYCALRLHPSEVIGPGAANRAEET